MEQLEPPLPPPHPPLFSQKQLWVHNVEEEEVEVELEVEVEVEVEVGLLTRSSRHPTNGVGTTPTTSNELEPVPALAPTNGKTSSEHFDQQEEQVATSDQVGDKNEEDKLPVKGETNGITNTVYFDKFQGTESVNGISEMQSEIPKIPSISVNHQLVKNVEDQKYFGLIPPPVEHLCDELNGSFKHFDNATKVDANVDLIREIEEDLMELDVEKVLEKQNTHDLFCPNCNSCITRRVILRRRKPQISNVRRKPKRGKKLDKIPNSVAYHQSGDIDKPEIHSNVPTMESDEQNNGTEQDQEAFSCLSCFSVFVPIGNDCFKIFQFFRQGRQNSHTQSPQEISQRENTGSPRVIGQRENIQSPQGVNLIGNAQSPQEISQKENSQAPQEIGQREIIQSPQGVNLIGNAHSPQEISQKENSQAPQEIGQREIIQSPQGIYPIENTQSPQEGSGKEKAQILQGISQNENIEPPQKVSQNEDTQSPHKRSLKENTRGPQLISHNEDTQHPQNIGSNEDGQSPQKTSRNENTRSPREIYHNESKISPQNIPTNKENWFFSIFAFQKSKATTVEKAGHAWTLQSSAVPSPSVVTNGEHIDGAAIKPEEPGISNIFSSTNSSLLDLVKGESREEADADMFQRNAGDNEVQDIETGLLQPTFYPGTTEVASSSQSRTQIEGRGAGAGEAHEWDILKSIVYGGLIESITSLGVVSSAAGAGADTLNVLALGLANLIGGLVIIGHHLRELKNDQPRGASTEIDAEEDRYQLLLGRRQNFALHVTVVILSFLIFGLVPPVVYGFSFRKGDDKDLKLAAVAGASLVCILLLALGKGNVRKPRSTYLRTVSYYVILGITASGISYLVGELIKKLLEQLGLFESSSAVSVPFLETIPLEVGRASY